MLFVIGADWTHEQIVFAHVRHEAAVWRELGITARVRCRCKLHARAVAQVIHPELSLRVKNQVFRIWSPHVCRHVIPGKSLLLPLILYLGIVWSQRSQLGRADQYFLLASRGVHVPQLSLLAFVVALHI